MLLGFRDIKSLKLGPRRRTRYGRTGPCRRARESERSDMITVSHGRLPTAHDKTEECLIFDRVKGKWQLRDVEIVRGFNTPPLG